MSELLDHLIKKGSYFYRPNRSGYTGFKFDAGRYTKAEAEAEASIEPWHMHAIHQDNVPDDTAPDRAISGLQAEIASLRALLARTEEYVIDGITELKSQAEMYADYPSRLPRIESQLSEARKVYADITSAMRGAKP